MPDNEIIKALDICSKSNNGCSYSKYPCKDCYLNGQPMCSSVLIQDTIDLINRQQAEINKLNAENMLTISERNAFRTSFYDVLKQLKIAKSEAIKEFVERLKKLDDFYDCIRTIGNVDKIDCMINVIDNLVKEMVGEE